MEILLYDGDQNDYCTWIGKSLSVLGTYWMSQALELAERLLADAQLPRERQAELFNAKGRALFQRQLFTRVVQPALMTPRRCREHLTSSFHAVC
jgi:hypothetical protein